MLWRTEDGLPTESFSSDVRVDQAQARIAESAGLVMCSASEILAEAGTQQCPAAGGGAKKAIRILGIGCFVTCRLVELSTRPLMMRIALVSVSRWTPCIHMHVHTV